MRLSAKRASEREEEGEGEREKERALVRMVHRVNVGKVGISMAIAGLLQARERELLMQRCMMENEHVCVCAYTPCLYAVCMGVLVCVCVCTCAHDSGRVVKWSRYVSWVVTTPILLGQVCTYLNVWLRSVLDTRIVNGGGWGFRRI
jgi:hypothetical protein